MLGLLVVITTILACSESDKTEKTESPATTTIDSTIVHHADDDGVIRIPYEMSDIQFELAGTPIELAGARLVPATGWRELPPSKTANRKFSFGPLENDTDSSIATVYFPGEKDQITVNQARKAWISRLSYNDSRNPESAALVHERQVDGMTAHVLSILGDYSPPDGSADKPLSNYRLVGIVIEAPEGNLYLELAGPDYTARIMIEAFMTMVYQTKKI